MNNKGTFNRQIVVFGEKFINFILNFIRTFLLVLAGGIFALSLTVYDSFMVLCVSMSGAIIGVYIMESLYE